MRRFGAACMILGLAVAMAFVIGRCDARPSKLDQSASARPGPVAITIAHDAAPAPAAGALRLEGQVVDDRDEPVAGATVTLAGLSASAVSGTDGAFVFEGLGGARYCAVASRGPDTFTHEACRHLTSDSEPVVLQLLPATSLSLRVIDRTTRAPVIGATITTGDREVTTDEHGAALLRGLAPGATIPLDVVHPDYEPTSVWHGLLLDINLHDDLVIALDHGVAISGTVIDSDGHPLANADVSVMASWRSNTQTDEHGRWSFTAMAAGPHKINAWVDEQAAEPLVIDLDGVTPRTDIVIHVATRAAVHVRGIVVDERDAPVAGAVVKVATTPYSSKQGETDHDGRFDIAIGHPDERVSVLAVKGDLADEAEVEDSQHPAPLRLVLESSSIAGVVVDGRGIPVPHATVILDATHNPYARFTEYTTDAHGRFATGGLDPGEHDLVVRPPGKEDLRGCKWVRASTGDHDLRLVSPDLTTITGVVTRGSAPLVDYAVMVDRESNLEVDGPPDMSPHRVHAVDGRFVLTGLPVGTWQLRFIGAGVRETQLAHVVTRAGHELDVGRIEVETGQQITGRVVDAGGRAVAGATVVVHREPYRPDALFGALFTMSLGTLVTRTDAEGRFAFAGIEPSFANRIVAIAEDRGASPDLALGGDSMDLQLVLAATGAIAGRIIGKCMPSWVRCATAGDSTGGLIGSLDFVDRFHCDNLPPGEYIVDGDGGGMNPHRVTVRAGEITSAQIECASNVLVWIDLGGRHCTDLRVEMAAEPHDLVGQHDCEWNNFELEPGTYRLCADATCVPLTVTTEREQHVRF